MISTLTNTNRDIMTEAKKSPKFRQASKDAMPRVRLAVEVYEARNAMGLSQQALAKEISSTQKVISRVENGDMDLGIGLLNRFVGKLGFNSDNLARVFNCARAYVVITAGTKKVETKNESMTIATGAVKTSFSSPLGGYVGSNSIK